MNIERYLGVYYLIFHRTSVTRRRLLTLLLSIFLIPTAVMNIISRNALVISCALFTIIFLPLFLFPFIFVNFKLFVIASKAHHKQATSPKEGITINLKNISTALWAVYCMLLLSIPISFNFAFELARKFTNTSLICLTYGHSHACAAINCTLNSLIFFWKNKVLCTEGIKILKTLKDRFV